MRANLGGVNGRGDISMNTGLQNAVGSNLGGGGVNANMSRNISIPNVIGPDLVGHDVFGNLGDYLGAENAVGLKQHDVNASPANFFYLNAGPFEY